MRRPVAGLGIVALLLAGCSHPSSTTYDSGDVGRTIETSEGSVVSSREVEITGQGDHGSLRRAHLCTQRHGKGVTEGGEVG